MDNGGRLARSPRSPRPQFDLKQAAFDAAAALCARPSSRSPAYARRGKRPSRLILTLERLPRRAGIIATLLLLALSADLGFVRAAILPLARLRAPRQTAVPPDLNPGTLAAPCRHHRHLAVAGPQRRSRLCARGHPPARPLTRAAANGRPA